MPNKSSAATFFNDFAWTFDTIYDKKRNFLMRWVDARFRSDIFYRFALCFEAFGNLEGKTLFDIGCGSGPYVLESFRRGASQVTALDPAPNMLMMVQERLEHTGFVERCSIIQGAFPGARVTPHDHVIVMGVMDYVVDAQAFLTALFGLGRVSTALSFPSKHWLRTPIRKLRYHLRRCPVYFYDANQIRSLASAAGFKNIDIKKIPGAGMDYFVCLKP